MNRLAVCLLLVGCSDNDGGGGNGNLALDQFAVEIATASCAKQFSCCTDAEIVEQYMGITFENMPIETEEQCVAFGTAVFSSFAVMRYQDSIAKGRVTYDGTAAADCVAAIEDVTCAMYAAGDITSSDCRPFLEPLVADGGGCTQDYECTSDNCEGESVPLDGTATDGTCKPMPAEGQPCDDSCATGQFCGSTPSSGTSICQATRADGMQCNLDRECASDHCDQAMDACAPKPPTCDGR